MSLRALFLSRLPACAALPASAQTAIDESVFGVPASAPSTHLLKATS